MDRGGSSGGGRCARCGCDDLEDASEKVSISFERSGVTATVTAPAHRCARCAEVAVDGATIDRCRLAACRALAATGVHDGEVLRCMRKALALRATDLARLLDVTPETVSHWETGKVAANRAVFATLGAMIEDALEGRTDTRDRLAALAGGGPYPRSVAVKLRDPRSR